MLHENLKALRKQKGLTQEELAIRLNVVRQTVSKWESGRSVPDADILMKIADVLDVSLSDLLGAELPHNEGQQNEIAAQLIRLNEQYAIRNRRSKRIWRVVLGVLVGLLALLLVLLFSGSILTPPLPRPPVRWYRMWRSDTAKKALSVVQTTLFSYNRKLSPHTAAMTQPPRANHSALGSQLRQTAPHTPALRRR